MRARLVKPACEAIARTDLDDPPIYADLQRFFEGFGVYALGVLEFRVWGF